MEEKKSLLERFHGLPKAKKAQLLASSVLTLFLLIAVPTFAWFSLSSKVETLTKIKAPTTLDIKSGHAYSIKYLNLSDIDVNNVDNSGNGYKDYIFAVKAGNSSAYDIQLAHTTNIPFEYTLYRAIELGDSLDNEEVPADNVATFEYNDEDASRTILYYYGYARSTATEKPSVSVSTPDLAKLELTPLNRDEDSDEAYGRFVAKKNDDKGIYSGKTQYNLSDDPEIYAVPLYSQHEDITTWDSDGDYFILRISWNTNNDKTAFAAWNAAANNKETDMIYISAKASA